MPVPLGTVAEVIRGVSFGASDPRPGPAEGVLPILRAGNIGDALDLVHDLIWVDKALVSRSQRLQLGDVAVCMSSGSARVVGKSAVLSESFNGAVGAFCAIVRPRAVIEPDYLGYYLRSPAFWTWRDNSARGVGIQNLKVSDLQLFPIPLPPLDEQRRIAARLREQLALQSSLAGHLRANQRSVQELERSLLAQAATTVLSTSTASIGDLTDSPPSPSVKSDGEAFVIAVTSGCLTAAGWSDAGLKTTRMHPADVARGTLEAGEVLVSRSNTEELVGRAAVFPGSAGPIVATDLVFRLRVVPDRLIPDYLATQLQVMQLGGYWHDRSSGASSTMKKITRTQLNAAVIPLPPLDQQERVVARMRRQFAEIARAMAALEPQRAAIDALPAAILREVLGEANAA